MGDAAKSTGKETLLGFAPSALNPFTVCACYSAVLGTVNIVLGKATP